MNIWKVFAPRHLWIFSDEGEKKKKGTHTAYSIIRWIDTPIVQHRGDAFGARRLDRDERSFRRREMAGDGVLR